jgi:starch phosphorylase
LELSRRLKKGADIWLNTPLRPLEASGTSGMSANMNGAVHLTTYDGWSVEGTFHEINGFIINNEAYSNTLSWEECNRLDYESMMHLLEDRIIPTYYDNRDHWAWIMYNAVHTSEAFFHSDRMAVEYFNKLYKPIHL